jgi:hypothetical protein
MSLMAWGNLSQSAYRFQRLNFRIRSMVMCTYTMLRSISLCWIHISLQCGCAISIIRHKTYPVDERKVIWKYLCFVVWPHFTDPLTQNSLFPIIYPRLSLWRHTSARHCCATISSLALPYLTHYIYLFA